MKRANFYAHRNDSTQYHLPSENAEGEMNITDELNYSLIKFLDLNGPRLPFLAEDEEGAITYNVELKPSNNFDDATEGAVFTTYWKIKDAKVKVRYISHSKFFPNSVGTEKETLTVRVSSQKGSIEELVKDLKSKIPTETQDLKEGELPIKFSQPLRVNRPRGKEGVCSWPEEKVSA